MSLFDRLQDAHDALHERDSGTWRKASPEKQARKTAVRAETFKRRHEIGAEQDKDYKAIMAGTARREKQSGYDRPGPKRWPQAPARIMGLHPDVGPKHKLPEQEDAPEAATSLFDRVVSPEADLVEMTSDDMRRRRATFKTFKTNVHKAPEVQKALGHQLKRAGIPKSAVPHLSNRTVKKIDSSGPVQQAVRSAWGAHLKRSKPGLLSRGLKAAGGVLRQAHTALKMAPKPAALPSASLARRPKENSNIGYGTSVYPAPDVAHQPAATTAAGGGTSVVNAASHTTAQGVLNKARKVRTDFQAAYPARGR